MYIIQYIICISQLCVMFGFENYVVYNDVQSCEVAASVKVKELSVSLDNKVVAARCVDESNNIVYI